MPPSRRSDVIMLAYPEFLAEEQAVLPVSTPQQIVEVRASRAGHAVLRGALAAAFCLQSPHGSLFGLAATATLLPVCTCPEQVVTACPLGLNALTLTSAPASPSLWSALQFYMDAWKNQQHYQYQPHRLASLGWFTQQWTVVIPCCGSCPGLLLLLLLLLHSVAPTRMVGPSGRQLCCCCCSV